MRKVYLGGPITGLYFDEAKDWRDSSSEFVQRLKVLGWESLSPMRNKEKFRSQKRLDAFFDEGAAAVCQDLTDIDKSQAVIINLLGADRVSLGSMAEMGYAYARNVPIIVITEGKSNCHHHVFTEYMATITVPTLVDALEAIVQFAGEAVPYTPPVQPLGDPRDLREVTQSAY